MERGGPKSELKTQKEDRKGCIDWFIYRERILNPLLFPFSITMMQEIPGLLIMKDNDPAHKYHCYLKTRE